MSFIIRDGQLVGLTPREYAEQFPVRDPEPEPVPESISDRQFAQQLAILGTITQPEAIAWAARGDLPAMLKQAIASLPEEGGLRFGAEMMLSSATIYERSHLMTATLGALLGYDDAALDDIWRAAALL